MSEEVPLFLLHTVLFPGGRLPLRIFEQRYMEMAKTCLKDNSPFGVCLIHQGKEVGEPAVPVGVGCLARIAEWDMPQLGVLQVTARGESRFRILDQRVQADGLVRASIELLPEGEDVPLPEAAARYAKLLERVIEQHPALLERPHRLDSSAWVSARLAELLPLPLEAKQALLETENGRARLEQLDAFVRIEPNKV
ncbi:MAG TPA: LON peptidase substrate-binding domain-containing protein [Burkholderiales bacterium]|nr:LON peptidase substrate-binding domain-containing protein [Burkholderiales bacterium]